MRTEQELMQEIRWRKKLYRTQKQFRRLVTAGAGIGALLLAALILAPNIRGNGSEHMTSTTLGATILGPEAGGYVIVALLAFAMGIVVSMIILKRKQIKVLEDKKEEKTHE